MNHTIKNFLFGNDQNNSAGQDIGFLCLRFFVGLALCTVFEKFFPINGIWGPQEWFIQDTASMGFPFPVFFAWVAVVSEFFGGILLMLGLFTRPAALLNVLVTFTATFLYHKGDIGGSGMLSFLFMIMCTCILLFGPGRFSLEYWMRRRLVKKLVTVATLAILLFSSNYAMAGDKNSITNSEKLVDSMHIVFYLKNNSLLPRKYTIIIYAPQQEGNSTRVKWFLPYQRIKYELPIGARMYIATQSQIDIVMQGNSINGDKPFVEVNRKTKNRTLKLNRQLQLVAGDMLNHGSRLFMRFDTTGSPIL